MAPTQKIDHEPSVGAACPRVAIVVPHWNRMDRTKACYASLQALECPNRSVVVVNNGSTAHTPSALEESCPGARVVHLENNLGFAKAVNAGIRTALDAGPVDYVWLVNNDITCPPRALAGLVRIAEENTRIGLVGAPLIEGADGGPRRRVAAGKCIRGPLYIPMPPAEGQAPDYVSGASLLIRRAVMENIGLLDEGFFFFFEDADYCRRAVQAGWTIAVAPDLGLRHIGSATIGALGALQARAYRAGHIRYVRKHGAFPFFPAVTCTAWRVLADAARGRFDAVRGTLQGWREGWRSV